MAADRVSVLHPLIRHYTIPPAPAFAERSPARRIRYINAASISRPAGVAESPNPICRCSVKHRTLVNLLSWVSILLVVMLGGCATTPAPDIRGRWQPVNRYSAQAEEIPLYQSYVFYPSPMDRTLKTMLARWAKDSKMTLSYQHPSDFTLHAPVAQIHTNDLQQAVAQLTTLYAPQRVSITASNNQIVVHVAGHAGMAPASGSSEAASP